MSYSRTAAVYSYIHTMSMICYASTDYSSMLPRITAADIVEVLSVVPHTQQVRLPTLFCFEITWRNVAKVPGIACFFPCSFVFCNQATKPLVVLLDAVSCFAANNFAKSTSQHTAQAPRVHTVITVYCYLCAHDCTYDVKNPNIYTSMRTRTRCMRTRHCAAAAVVLRDCMN